jgi:aminoglycoside 2'-N-acetyltransferase I
VTDVLLRWSTQLTAADHAAMAPLFDAEYAPGWGPWSARSGYGYAALELHALARHEGRLIGHAGTARRFVGVGDREVVISGIGGVVTHPEARGRGVGRAVLTALQDAVSTWAPASFGLLGCREEVVPFYESCGFTRVDALVRDLSPRDAATVVQSRGPTLVCAGTEPVEAWPAGTIDLRGLPW